MVALLSSILACLVEDEEEDEKKAALYIYILLTIHSPSHLACSLEIYSWCRCEL